MLKSLNRKIFSGIVAAAFGSPLALAKGLETLSENNPETKSAEEADTADTADNSDAKESKGSAPTATTTAEKSATSQKLAGKLWVATSYGWVKASRSEGNWTGSGMSDITVGYHIMPIGSKMAIDGTYRYAPIAISGDIDGQSYRGVWDTHYFGGRFNYQVNDKLTALGTGEIGYALVYLRPTDTFAETDEHQKNGVSIVVGGGADWRMLDSAGLSVGPRLNIGLGGMTTIQVAGAATFAF